MAVDLMTSAVEPAALPDRPVRRRRRRRLVPALPLLVLVVLVGGAIFAPLFSTDPNHQELIESLTPPAWTKAGTTAHLLGTDQLGRDVFARLLYGARASLSVAAVSLLIAIVLGGSLGILAGYLGGWVDNVLMRVTDVVLSLPIILVALTVGVALGPSFWHLVLALGFMLWPQIARLVRGETLVVRQAEFVRYARVIGVPAWLVIIRHVLPNILATLIVAATLEIAHVVLLEASLSFLGAGLPATTPSWGGMIADGRALIATGWWIALFAGLAITVTVLTFNVLGDWLRDRLDPRLRNV
jgi:peptide/nickel transport system permease protein